MTQTTINNGDVGLTVRTALNTMFGEIYGELAGGSAFLTGSGTWTVPASSSGFVWVEFAFLTAGGGGGGVANAAAITTGASGSSGWFGTLMLKLASGTVVSYNCGAAGVGGAAGANSGTAGGSLTITVGATVYTIPGGVGGTGAATGNAVQPNTAAALNAAFVTMAITPTADAFYTAFPVNGTASVGATNIGGLSRNTPYGVAGVPAVNSAGGSATGYGAAGAGAGHDAATATNLAGGNASPGCLFVKW